MLGVAKRARSDMGSESPAVEQFAPGKQFKVLLTNKTKEFKTGH